MVSLFSAIPHWCLPHATEGPVSSVMDDGGTVICGIIVALDSSEP